MGCLYAFLMRFVVLVYVVNPIESIRNGRPVIMMECAEMLESFRLFRLRLRLASSLQTRGPRVLFKPTKEKASVALASLPGFAV